MQRKGRVITKILAEIHIVSTRQQRGQQSRKRKLFLKSSVSHILGFFFFPPEEEAACNLSKSHTGLRSSNIMILVLVHNFSKGRAVNTNANISHAWLIRFTVSSLWMTFILYLLHGSVFHIALELGYLHQQPSENETYAHLLTFDRNTSPLWALHKSTSNIFIYIYYSAIFSQHIQLSFINILFYNKSIHCQAIILLQLCLNSQFIVQLGRKAWVIKNVHLAFLERVSIVTVRGKAVTWSRATRKFVLQTFHDLKM